jgi:hypothetical protein
LPPAETGSRTSSTTCAATWPNPDIILTVEQAEAMEARLAELEPLVGDHLQRMLAAEG